MVVCGADGVIQSIALHVDGSYRTLWFSTKSLARCGKERQGSRLLSLDDSLVEAWTCEGKRETSGLQCGKSFNGPTKEGVP